MSVQGLPHAGDGDFDQAVLSQPSPVLVEFFAPWCGHCRRMAPIVEDVARDYAGQLRVVQVSVDENEQAPGRFGVTGVPTLIIFANGKEIDRTVGETSKEALEARIQQALALAPQRA